VLEPERALPLVEQVADALDATHERGLVHRDVKPSTCWFDGRGHCYLADFGLYRRLAEQATDRGDGRSLGRSIASPRSRSASGASVPYLSRGPYPGCALSSDHARLFDGGYDRAIRDGPRYTRR